MKIENYLIRTVMGETNHEYLPFLTMQQLADFNSIGYTGNDLKGNKSNFESFLNSINKNWSFKVQRTKFDDGDFCEEYIITRVSKENVKDTVSKGKEKNQSSVEWFADEIMELLPATVPVFQVFNNVYKKAKSKHKKAVKKAFLAGMNHCGEDASNHAQLAEEYYSQNFKS